jgi:hypothetical protein
MKQSDSLPASILGGDPFNQFRFLYRREFLWKLFDEEYCFSVMRAYYQGGGYAFDLSFEVNTRLFRRLLDETGTPLLGFGNPSWEQGVFLNRRFLQYSRDRILRTLVDRMFPRPIASQVEERLAKEDVLVFGFDQQAEPLSDKEIASIYLDEDIFLRRLSMFADCQYIFLGGSDADWLVSLGRADIINRMSDIVRQQGFSPYLLCQYATLVVPILENNQIDVDGYCLPLNKEWSWFDRDECVKIVHALAKPVIAFMPFASGSLRKDIPGALDWLYLTAGVKSILFGTATAHHAEETACMAEKARSSSRSTSVPVK